ncbi:hypothetical protein SAMN04490244_103174 [Tranquillimonas rosea]|uniref:Peptide methionine sulfoxide reductase n=1 Tax=Tranquillimonas rosea TaxID=641238 RepID=A0A1H9SGL8_9RHOB|nr:hypothetical protein [Tranquillimonas rosea]SER83543.1 hypothetical protein SAMN04490244_103174 [Tranquillimonas rosea]
MTDAFRRAFDALPEGTFTGTAHGRRWVVAKTSWADGRSRKLWAEAEDGDHVSLNLYTLRDGRQRLRPCEMSDDKVVAFVLALVPDQ